MNETLLILIFGTLLIGILTALGYWILSSGILD